MTGPVTLSVLPEDLRVTRAEVAPTTRRGGDVRVVLGPRTVGSTSGFGGTVDLRPGECVTEHYHPYSEEFLHVVHGALRMRLDGTWVDLAAGQSLLVPRGVRHRLQNDGDENATAVFHLGPLAPRPQDGHVDTEPRPRADAPLPEVGGTP